MNHEYMAQPGGLRRPLRGADREKSRTKKPSDQRGLTQANRPPRFPVRFKPFHDEHQTARRATVLRGIAARQGEGNACSSRLIVEQAAQRFFELVKHATDGLRGRFTEREWEVLLSCEPSPAWHWHRWTTVATMVADDLGIDSLDELHPDSQLRALLVKLEGLSPLENATLVDACERVWRGLENPLR